MPASNASKAYHIKVPLLMPRHHDSKHERQRHSVYTNVQGNSAWAATCAECDSLTYLSVRVVSFGDLMHQEVPGDPSGYAAQYQSLSDGICVDQTWLWV